MIINDITMNANRRHNVIGPSGARLVISDESTFKYDTPETNGRVRAQGIWLRSNTVHEIVSAPEVYAILPDGYEMETLSPDPLHEVDVSQRVALILETLRVEWWGRVDNDYPTTWVDDELSDFSPRAHARYVAQLCRTVNCRDLIKILGEFRDKIDWFDLERGLTHGDPIVDNALWRLHKNAVTGSITGRKLVLIDPIPPTISIPPLVCVDIGRLIQSTVGYEQARYGITPLNAVKGTTERAERVTELLNAALFGDFSLNEARASLYWSVIHMMRGVRTARLPETQAYVRKLVYVLVDSVVKPWMR